MKARKGQAVMEYLMTYGWAIVALVLVIGALLATGAFNPSYLVSEECTLQPDLSCTGHVLYVENDDFILKFRISNGLGHDIKFEGSNVVKVTSNQEEYFLDASDLGLAGGVLEQGETVIAEVELGDIAGSVGDIKRMSVSLDYVSCAPEVNPECSEDEPVHTISGRIVARIEEKEN
jgi:hypothetical protein